MADWKAVSAICYDGYCVLGDDSKSARADVSSACASDVPRDAKVIAQHYFPDVWFQASPWISFTGSTVSNSGFPKFAGKRKIILPFKSYKINVGFHSVVDLILVRNRFSPNQKQHQKQPTKQHELVIQFSGFILINVSCFNFASVIARQFEPSECNTQ